MLTLKPDAAQNGVAKNDGRKILGAPVQIGAIVATSNVMDDSSSLWIQKMDDSLRYTDSKKLEKAEQQLAKKAEKKENTVSQPVNRYKNNEASASQIISRKNDASSSTTKDIKIEGFDVAFGEKVLLKNADVSLTFGRRYGLVGRNGLGKSTLLHMMSSRQLLIPSHMSILHVEQEVIGDDTLALQSVLESDTKRESLLKEEVDINKKMAEG